MIYLAESGSTKCDAVFLDKNGQEHTRIETIGFNPYFHSSEFVAEEIQKVPQIQEWGRSVKEVYFYSAGCSTPDLQAKIERGLRAGFPKAHIHVDHDLKAAALATYRGEAQITCILGTGSNCLYFDGQKLIRGRSGYGYILGDEGSATYIGKRLIAAYLYREMPEHLRAEFENAYPLTVAEIQDRVYNQPNANVFLGGFAPFAQQRVQHPFFYQLVFEGFRQFLGSQVIQLPQAGAIPINFVGSVAHHFESVLRDALDFYDLEMGIVVPRPLDGLIHYHQKHRLGQGG